MTERGFTVILLKNVKIKDRLIVSMTKLLVKVFLLINENDSHSQYIELSFHQTKQSTKWRPENIGGEMLNKTKACFQSLMNPVK